jgi:hypothetical protein
MYKTFFFLDILSVLNGWQIIKVKVTKKIKFLTSTATITVLLELL